MRHPREDIPVGTCPTCGKRCYLARDTAKKAAKRNHPGEHLSAYQCGPYWHLGHLPGAVVHGVLPRTSIPRRTTS